MCRLLIFAGTTEGRELIEFLRDYAVQLDAFVATEYGREVVHPQENLHLHVERLDFAGMLRQLERCAYTLVIDATHPHAVEVSRNIRKACAEKGVPMLRVIREGNMPRDCVCLDSAEQAAKLLANTSGRVLITTGSKSLPVFASVPGFSERFFVRILPSPEAVGQAVALGYPMSHLICMQGPFSKELNLAMLRQIGASSLVTKDSGKAGGFAEKAEAAKACGAKLLVIGRPYEEGFSLREAKVQLQERFALRERKEKRLYFPLFISLWGKKVQVFGGGNVALRRVKTLLSFGCRIEVVSPEVCGELRRLAQERRISLTIRPYRLGDCLGASLVVAATDSRAVNRAIAAECGENIPVSVADCKEESSFYFPAVITDGRRVIAVNSAGDYRLTKRTADRIREWMQHETED